MQANNFLSFLDYNNFAEASRYDDAVRNGLDAARDLLEINNRVFGRLLDNQVTLACLFVEGGEKQFETTCGSGSLEEFLSRQTDLFNACAARLTEAAGSQIKLAQQAGEDYQAWFYRALSRIEALDTGHKLKSGKTKKQPAVSKRLEIN